MIHKGIAIFGLNGGGKSTLAHALAKRLGYFEMDVEDYYFPEQASSRKRSLENNTDSIETEYLGNIPFSVPRTEEEVQSRILEDICVHTHFVLSGVTMNWSDETISAIDIAFWVQAPLEERLKRIQGREQRRFGVRVLPGGDMYEQQKIFRNMVAARDSSGVEESAKRLICPIYTLDGMLPVETNLERIMSC